MDSRLAFLIAFVCFGCGSEASSSEGAPNTGGTSDTVRPVDAGQPPTQVDATAGGVHDSGLSLGEYCRSLTEQECALDPSCHPRTGLRYYSEEGCSREEVAECRPRGEVCSLDIVFAMAPDGACWMIDSSTCLPNDFERVVSGHCMPDAGLCA